MNSSEHLLVNASGLYRYYGDYCAVNGVAITLKPGDILGLLGPNGAGKTSTMSMLTGNLAPSDGNIKIKGVDLLDDPKTAKRSIGYLPEQPPVYRDLTVVEYLVYCGRLKGIHGGELKNAVDKAMERTGLTQTGKRLIGNLSKGYQQRVGIAQAIIHEPDVIILDEPTVGLDPIQIREIRALIRELGQRHGIILSTHILPEVQTVCNRIHIMNNGCIAYDADTDKQHDLGQLLLRFQRKADLDSLAAIDAVHQVTQLHDGAIRISHAADRSPAADIARLAVERDWGLLEMTPESLGLEQIFIELTQGDEPQSTGEKAA
jgi:ABC-2 type transport system ATP-binding protein